MALPDSPEPAWRDHYGTALHLADIARGHTAPRFFDPALGVAGAVDNKAGPAGFDPVTDADREAERAVRAYLATACPDHGVEGEEFPDTPAQGPWSWTLDPVDGTRAFMCGFPTWTTLIALSHTGAPVLGVIDQPVLDDCFIGTPDGAFRRRAGTEQPLMVRPCARLTDAVVAATGPDMFTPAEKGGFDLIAHAARLTRYGADAYAYAMLAAGRVDVVIEAGLKPYDVRALIPVVRGAGGIITDWRGDPDRVQGGGQVIAAGDARIHAEALSVLRRATW